MAKVAFPGVVTTTSSEIVQTCIFVANVHEPFVVIMSMKTHKVATNMRNIFENADARCALNAPTRIHKNETEAIYFLKIFVQTENPGPCSRVIGGSKSTSPATGRCNTGPCIFTDALFKKV